LQIFNSSEVSELLVLYAPHIHIQAYCDNPTRDNSILSPKPLHLVIKQ
jgi:hypothetical protein